MPMHENIKGFGPLTEEHKRLIEYLNSVNEQSHPEYYSYKALNQNSKTPNIEYQRKILRTLFAQYPTSTIEVNPPAAGSPIERMLINDENGIAKVAITQWNGKYSAQLLKAGARAPINTVLVLDKAQIRERQQAVKSFIKMQSPNEASQVTPEQVVALHLRKTGGKVADSEENLNRYSYNTMAIATASQTMLAPEGTVQVFDRVITDLRLPTVFTAQEHPSYTVKDKDKQICFNPVRGKGNFIQDLMSSMKFGVEAAAEFGAGLMLFMPVSTYTPLTKITVKEANTVFNQACLAIAESCRLPNSPGIVLFNDSFNHLWNQIQHLDNPQIPVLLCSSKLNRSAVQLAAKRLNLSLSFAEPVENEPLKPVGQRSISNNRFTSTDALTCLETAGESAYLLSSLFNRRLLSPDSHVVLISQEDKIELETITQIHLDKRVQEVMLKIGTLFNASPYIWGGWVRDTLDGIPPNDIDIFLVPNPNAPIIGTEDRKKLLEEIKASFANANVLDTDKNVPGLFQVELMDSPALSIDFIYPHRQYSVQAHLKTCDLLVNSLVCNADGEIKGMPEAVAAHKNHVLTFNPSRNRANPIRPKEVLRQHRNYVSHLLKHKADNNIPEYHFPDKIGVSGIAITNEEFGELRSELIKQFVKTKSNRLFMFDHWIEAGLFASFFKGLSREMTEKMSESEKAVAISDMQQYFMSLSDETDETKLKLELILKELIKITYRHINYNVTPEKFILQIKHSDTICRMFCINKMKSKLSGFMEELNADRGRYLETLNVQAPAPETIDGRAETLPKFEPALSFFAVPKPAVGVGSVLSKVVLDDASACRQGV